MVANPQKETKKKASFRLPHVFILLMIVMLIVVGLSWVVPSGQFEVVTTETGAQMINPEKFSYITNDTPIKFMDFFMAVHNGIVQSGDIIINLLIVSGVLFIVEKTGSIGAGIHKIIDISQGKELLVIAVLTFIFAVLGAIGFGEGGLPFIPLTMTVVMALGYDRIAGVATALLGMGVGFASGVLNLYTTGISQSIVGLPMFSGMQFRIVGFLVFYIITVTYICMYCKKIKKDPTKSVVASEYTKQNVDNKNEEKIEMNWQRGLSLLILAGLFVLQAYGATKLGWGFANISAIYVVFAIFLIIIFKINPSEGCNIICQGATRLLPAALTIGLARSVMILMTQAKIIDTAIYNVANVLDGKGAFTSLLIVYLVVIAFNFFVVSGSGKAVIMMPILGPLGKLLNINQQVMVLVYQYGDGFTNYLWPTSGGLMAGLAMCDVEWQDWVKFSGKLFAILITVAFGLVLVANAMNLGPF